MLSFEDKAEIRDLVYRFNRAVDYGTPDEWADTFVSEGVFDSAITGVLAGREELMGWLAEFRSDPKYAALSKGQHWTTNIVVSGNADHARLWASVMLLVPSAPNPHIAMFGYYDDELVKVAGTWKFSLRKLTAAEAS